MNTSINNKLFIGFSLAVAFLLFFTIVTFVNMTHLKRDYSRQYETYEILNNIDELFTSIIEIETNQRGYAISGKKSFLDVYEENISQIGRKLSFLGQKADEGRINKVEFRKLKDIVHDKVETCNKIISIRNDYGEAAAIKMIQSEIGKILTFKIRGSIKILEETERLKLIKSNQTQLKSANFTLLIFAVLCFVIITILALVLYYYTIDQREKKIAERNLSTVKDQLQSVLDNTPSLVFIKDLEGRFLFVNKPFEKKVKLTSQFILGNTDFDLFSKDIADHYWESDNETILNKKLIEFDGMIMENEGPTYFHTVKFPLFNNENKMYAICGITADITKRKETEQNLKATKDQLQSILDNTNSLVAIRGIDGTFLFVNKEYEKLFHASSSDILGKTVFDFLPKESAEDIWKNDQEVIRSRQLKEFEIDFPVDDEIHYTITSKFPLYNSENKIYGVCAVSTDITERKLAEEKLKKAYIFQNAILNGTDYSIIATDAYGKIVEFNKGSEALLGYNSQEVIYKSSPELFVDSDLLTSLGILNQENNYPSQGNSHNFEKTFVSETFYATKDKIQIPVLLSVSALRDDVNEVRGYLFIARNITEQRLAESKLQESQLLFEHMSANVPGVIFQYALMPNGEREFRYVSSGIRELFEMEPEYLKSDATVFRQLLAKEDVENFFKGMFESAKTLEPFAYETKAVLPSGKVKWIKSNAKPDRKPNGEIVWDGVMMDITTQKETELKLIQSQERYEIAVVGANDGLWDWNLITNDVYFSPRWKSMLGYQEHELKNHLDTFTKLLHPDTVKNVFDVVNDYLAGNLRNYEIELQLLHKKGYYHWVLARGAVLRDKQGKAYRFAGSHTDIMQRKFQEEALRSSEAKFRAMTEASPLGVFVTDPEGQCVYTNFAYQEISGYKPDDLLGDGWLNAIHPDDRTQVDALWKKATTEKIRFESVHRFLRPGGSVVYTNVKAAEMVYDNKIIGYVGTVDDLTAMKIAEEKIMQSTYMINNASDAIITSDRDWVINSYNNAARKIYGFEPEEILGKKVKQVLETTFINGTIQDMYAALKEKGEWHGEVIQKNKAGDEIPILVSLTVNRDNQGNEIGYLSVNRDISERKKREYVIEQLNRELEKNLNELENTNRELESFSYTISHDLRAPLRAIDGFTQILKEDYIERLDEEAVRLMDVVMNNAKRMGQLIDDLLHFSRLSKQEIIKTTVNMDDLVHQVLSDIKSSTTDLNATIRLKKLPTANADHSTIKQVWMNLITNAIKYSKTKEKPQIEIGCLKVDKEHHYYVKDNGVGFNMHYYDKLFGVFQRLHSGDFEGTGVGLAIVHRIIHKNGGRVWAEAEVNKGATFYFCLPE